MKRGALSSVLAAAVVAAALAAAGRPAPDPAATPLPALGTPLSEFPAGEAKDVAEKACLQCHSADMPRQQRLNEKQWTSEVEKMTRWGAEVPPDRKDALVAYLFAHFGPGNDAFTPVEVAPVSRSAPSH
ncbi:MAG TPA: hypothetical protein VFL12_00165 [Thermoanaerobaculia bacterium]|nr:hypothetical protein [Thermoanaerobaculia bacterium]